MARARLVDRRSQLNGAGAKVAIANSLQVASSTSLRTACIAGISVLGALLFALANFQKSSSGYIDGTLLRVASTIPSSSLFAPSTASKLSMKEWRDAATQECQTLVEKVTNHNDIAQSLQDKEALERNLIDKLTLPSNPVSEIPTDIQEQPYRRCKNVFIDLGTNIGDSVGYFIDNAIDNCTPLWAAKFPKTKFNADFPRPHLDVTTLTIQHKGNKGNPLFGLLQKQAQDLPSESFCVYGMEGNPTFTPRLSKLENFIRTMQPSPVQHVHIFTESVVTATDGQTKLYLDKTSVDQNFWGSSILSSQQDAVKSAKELNNGEVFSADVMGISLSSMVKNAMLAFQERVTQDDQRGGLLIIKMDVEGAEYQVLKEVAESNILCDFIKLGNRVVFVVEYHNMSITNSKERKREKDGHEAAVKKLKTCGVNFEKLHAFWA